MAIPNKFCPLGLSQGLVCRGDMCMWFDRITQTCMPLGCAGVKEEKPKTSRAKKKGDAPAE